MQPEFCVLLLLESRNIAVKTFVFLRKHPHPQKHTKLHPTVSAKMLVAACPICKHFRTSLVAVLYWFPAQITGQN